MGLGPKENNSDLQLASAARHDYIFRLQYLEIRGDTRCGRSRDP
jgi:hypothetical protein